MYTALSILTIAVLLCVALQDFYQRSIYWWLCPLLALLLIYRVYQFSPDRNFTLTCWLVNITVVTIQLATIWLYTLVKKKSSGRTLSSSIGLGDVVFLYAACFIEPPFLFVAVCCLSYTTALIAKLAVPSKFTTIPLAGWVAVFMSAALMVELVRGAHSWNFMLA